MIGPKTQELISFLDVTAQRLRTYGEDYWAEWLEDDAQLLRSEDFRGIEHLLSAYGGMGSFNDVYLCPTNGNKIAESEVKAADEWLDAQRSKMYDLAEQIRHSVERSSKG
jgi:hypothetical protein